jgi:V/A-type H+-transporting ATPase subunit E
MELIDSSKKKVKKICDVLIKETLEPAQKKAEDIIEEAQKKAASMIAEAKEKGAQLIKEAEAKIKEKQTVFDSSIKIAAQKTLTLLRDQIEHQLFLPELESQIKKCLGKKDVVVKLIDALVHALNVEGIKADLSVIISKDFNPEEICAAILEESLSALKGKVIRLGEEKSGVTLKCEGYHLSLDVTDDAIREIVSAYASEQLRKILFKL